MGYRYEEGGLKWPFASPQERELIEAAEAALDRAAKELAALVYPQAFREKLEELIRERGQSAARGRPTSAARLFMRLLLEATGDVEDTRFAKGEVNAAVANCLADMGKPRAEHPARMRMVREVRRELKAQYDHLGPDSVDEVRRRASYAEATLRALHWLPDEEKAVYTFLARFGAVDVSIEKSPRRPRRRTED